MGGTGQSQAPTAEEWSARIVGGALLGLIAVSALLVAVYEYHKWNTARSVKGIVSDYAPADYLAAMVISGIVCLASIAGLYAVWRHRSH
jgi:hypothetical protein